MKKILLFSLLLVSLSGFAQIRVMDKAIVNDEIKLNNYPIDSILNSLTVVSDSNSIASALAIKNFITANGAEDTRIDTFRVSVDTVVLYLRQVSDNSIVDSIEFLTSAAGDNLGDHTATEDIDAGGFRVKNIPTTPSAGNDAASKNYVDSENTNDLETDTEFGGDITGTYNSINVGRIQGDSISVVAPTNNQVLKWNASTSRWTPSADVDFKIDSARVYGSPDTVVLYTFDYSGAITDSVIIAHTASGGGGTTEEEVEDWVGGMLSGNTETLITVTYQDADGTIDFVVDNDLANYSNATSGFLTGNETITISGDATGSGTTSITLSLAANSVGNAEIATNAVSADELAANSVGASEIQTGAVGTDEIDNGSIAWVDLSSPVQDSIQSRIDGEGAANRIAIFSDAKTLTSDANITYDGETLTVDGAAGELLGDFGDFKIYESATGSYVLFENGVGLSPISQARTGWVSHQFYNSGGNMFRMDAHATDTTTVLIEPGKRPPSLFESLGRLYVDVDDNTIYFFNGTSWVDLAAAGGTGESNVITSDTELTDQDTIRRDPDGGTYVFDKGLNAEMKIGYDYVVDSVVNVLGGNFELGKYIYVTSTEAKYLIRSDSVANFVTDSVIVIPTQNAYAILATKVLRPQFWGAKVNDTNSDSEAFNRMFRFIEGLSASISDTDFPKSTYIELTPGDYRVDSTVFLPRTLGGTTINRYLFIAGNDAKIIAQSGCKWIFKVIGANATLADEYMPANSGSWTRINYHINMEGIEFVGINTSGVNGVYIAGATYSQFKDLKFSNFDTSAIWAVSYGSTYADMEFENFGSFGPMFVTQFFFNGGNPASAGFTTNVIDNLRCYGGNWKSNTDLTRNPTAQNRAIAGYYFEAISGASVRSCVSEGIAPFYDFLIDMKNNTVANHSSFDQLWLESTGFSTLGLEIRNPKGTFDLLNLKGELSRDTTVRVIRTGTSSGAHTVINFNQPTQSAYPKVYLYNSDMTPVTLGASDLRVNHNGVLNSSAFNFPVQLRAVTSGSAVGNDIKTSNFFNSASGAYFYRVGAGGTVWNSSNYYKFFPAIGIVGNVWFSQTVDGLPTYSRVGKDGVNTIEVRPMSYWARQEGFITDIGGQFAFAKNTDFVENDILFNQFFAYALRMDSTGYAANTGLQNIFIDVGSADEFRFYNNGQAKFEKYASANDLQAGAISKTFQTLAGWATDGTLLHVDTINASTIFTGIDSIRLDDEITGILSRIDALSASSGIINEGFSLGNGADVFKETSNDTLKFRSLVPGGGVTISQTDTTISIAATGLYGVIQDFTPTDTIDWDLNTKISGAAHIDCTSVSAGVGLNIINPNTSYASYYTLYFYNVSGTDAITFPTGWIGEDGTALGTVNLTTDKYYACQYLGIDASNLYLCK